MSNYCATKASATINALDLQTPCWVQSCVFPVMQYCGLSIAGKILSTEALLQGKKLNVVQSTSNYFPVKTNTAYDLLERLCVGA